MVPILVVIREKQMSYPINKKTKNHSEPIANDLFCRFKSRMMRTWADNVKVSKVKVADLDTSCVAALGSLQAYDESNEYSLKIIV